MPESESHKRAKSKAAGRSGRTEVPLKGGGRLDATTAQRATEVERSDSLDRLKKAAERLRDSGKRQKVLRVPNNNMDKAVDAMRAVGISGTVSNLSGTQRRSVRAGEK